MKDCITNLIVWTDCTRKNIVLPEEEFLEPSESACELTEDGTLALAGLKIYNGSSLHRRLCMPLSNLRWGGAWYHAAGEHPVLS